VTEIKFINSHDTITYL